MLWILDLRQLSRKFHLICLFLWLKYNYTSCETSISCQLFFFLFFCISICLFKSSFQLNRVAQIMVLYLFFFFTFSAFHLHGPAWMGNPSLRFETSWAQCVNISIHSSRTWSWRSHLMVTDARIIFFFLITIERRKRNNQKSNKIVHEMGNKLALFQWSGASHVDS